jgi:hypothetical protein
MSEKAETEAEENGVFDVLRNRYREKDRINEAVEAQDELRAKTVDTDWSGADEVRRWRKKR